jgi:creatinine amidohydrolase
MGYSIFEDTMADMTFPEIESAAEHGAVVLVPVAVIEAHGPHLCLGTDTYTAYQFSIQIKKSLAAKDVMSLVAPPFYWGINHETAAFPGSFNVRSSTMKALLFDILESLHRWGFERVFLMDFHGDDVHKLAILSATKKARDSLGLQARFILSGGEVHTLELDEGDPAILLFAPLSAEEKEAIPDPSKIVDGHAGTRETSFMALHYPALVNLELAEQLVPTNTMREQAKTWRRGGDEARKLSPLGYIGDPAAYDVERLQQLEKWFVETIASVIKLCLD